MKKLKLIFGLLLVAAFVAITVLSYSSNNSQAIDKRLTSMETLPPNG